jgi:hypothetical protein
MGAVVLRQSEENSDEWDVIDGQQRLTTVTLLLAALRDVTLPIVKPGRKPAAGAGVDPEIAELRKNFNGNYFVTPPTRPGARARPRIIPQQRDAIPFNAVLNWSNPEVRLNAKDLGLLEPSNVLPAYNYFKRLLRLTPDQAARDDALAPHQDLFPLDVELVKQIAVGRLLFIEVRTTSIDDANAIFESLNFKVVPLGAVDLLKNYLFMLLRNDADRLLNEWWNPSVQRLGSEKALADFILADLVSRGQATSRNSLYEAKQSELRTVSAKLGSDGLWEELARLRTSVGTFLEASDPATHCKRPKVREALISIHDAQGATAVPLLMSILRDAEAVSAPEDEICAALRLVESYLVRRFLVGYDAHNLNSYFSSMLSRAFGKDASRYAALSLVDRVAAMLDSAAENWPRDDRLRESILLGDFYRGETAQRMLVFKRLDREHGQKLEVSYSESAIEVEHIFPRGAEAEQSGYWMDSAQQADMSVQEFQRRYLHALANLTPLLKKENGSAGNSPFSAKRDIYGLSSLVMTRVIADQFPASQGWSEVQLRQRADALTKHAVSAWPRPDARLSTDVESVPELAADEDLVPGQDELVEDTLNDEGVV